MTRPPLEGRPGRRVPARPGLPAERTELAWERSALGLFAGAALLMFRHVEPLTPPRAVLLAGYLTLGLVTLHLGLRRGRTVRRLRAGRCGGAPIPAARGSVLLLGWSVVALAAGTGAVLLG